MDVMSQPGRNSTGDLESVYQRVGSSGMDESDIPDSLQDDGDEDGQPPNKVAKKMTRVSRNEMEKARRDRLNRLIEELAKSNPIIFMANRKLDKSSILRLTVNFLRVHHDLAILKGEKWRPEFLDDQQLGSALMSLVGGFLFIISEKFVLHFATSALTTMLGHNLVDVLEHPVSKIVHPEDMDIIKRQFAKRQFSHPDDPSISPKLYRSGRRSFYLRVANHCNRQVAKYDNVHLVGHLKEFPAVQSAFSPPDHEAIGEACLIGIGKVEPANPMRDILPSLYDSAPQQWISRHDLDGKITFSDQRSSWFTGFFSTESIGIPVYTLIHPDDIRNVVATHNIFLKTGRIPPGSTIFRMLTKNTEVLYVKTNTHLVVDMWTKQNKYIISVNEVVIPEEAKKLFEKRDELLPQIEAEVGGPTIIELPDSDTEATDNESANGIMFDSPVSPAGSGTSVDSVGVRIEREGEETAVVYVQNRKFRIRMGSTRNRNIVGVSTAPHMDQTGKQAKEIPTVMPTFLGQPDMGYRERWDGSQSDFSPMGSPMDGQYGERQWRSRRTPSYSSSVPGDATDVSFSPGPSPGGVNSPQGLQDVNNQLADFGLLSPRNPSPGPAITPNPSSRWSQDQLMSPHSTTCSSPSRSYRTCRTNGNELNTGPRQSSPTEPKLKRLKRSDNTRDSVTQVDTSWENNKKLLELLKQKPNHTSPTRRGSEISSQDKLDLSHSNKPSLPNGGSPGPPPSKGNEAAPPIEQVLSQQLWARQEGLHAKIAAQERELNKIQKQLIEIKEFGGDPAYPLERVTELEMERRRQENLLIRLQEEHRKVSLELKTNVAHHQAAPVRSTPTSTVSVPPPDSTPVSTALQINMNLVSSGPNLPAYDQSPSSSISIDTGQNESLLMRMPTDGANPSMSWPMGTSQPHDSRLQLSGPQALYPSEGHNNPSDYSFDLPSGIQSKVDMPCQPLGSKVHQGQLQYVMDMSSHEQLGIFGSGGAEQTMLGSQSMSLNQSPGLLAVANPNGDNVQTTNFGQDMGVAQVYGQQHAMPLDPAFQTHQQHQQYSEMVPGETPLPTLDGRDTESILDMVSLGNQQIDMTDLLFSNSMNNGGVS